jgi:predicted dehydrogenase
LINKEGDSYKPIVKKSEPLADELGHFITCIEKKQRPKNDGYVGLRTVKMAEAALRSAKEKRTVQLDNNGNSS